MTDYGASDTSTTTLGANQFPIGEAWTPNLGFSAVEGGAQTTDSGGKKSAPVRVEVKDGSDITQGAQSDAAYISGAGSVVALLKGIFAKLLDLDTVTVPGQQGWIAATGTGTAGVNDSLTFANQVRKVVLYNASSLPVPFEFDVAAAADSIAIQPGQWMVFDGILCTIVHVFPSATLPINTTAGLYVKGWK